MLIVSTPVKYKSKDEKEKTRWVKVGYAHKNKDESLNVYLIIQMA